MSSICGVAGPYKSLSCKVLEEMNNIVKYRGPEDEGYCVVSSEKIQRLTGADSCMELIEGESNDLSKMQSDGFLYFGHRKLLLKGVNEKECQPVIDSMNQIVLIMDGTIYNRDDVMDELKQAGNKAKICSDAELVVESYKQWGCECVSHFNGIWGFALWDGNKNQLFCSRDRMGEKPFHYYYDGSSFIFGSEIKQLLVLPTIEPIMNERVLATNLVYHIRDYDENTLVKGVKELRGGHNLIISIDPKTGNIEKFSKKQYWDLDVSLFKKEPKEGYVEVVRREFERAVELRLRDQASYGAMLSGGLDSSVLVAEIGKQRKAKGESVEDFSTFSTKYDQASKVDESYYAHLVNEFVGCKEHLITPEIHDFKKAVEDCVWHVEADGSIATIHGSILAKIAKEQGIDVLFNGQAGDETMFGYEKYYATYFLQLLKQFHWIRFVKDFKGASKNSRLNAKLLMKFILYYGCPSIRNKRAKQLGAKYFSNRVLNHVDVAHLRKLTKVKNMQELQKNELINIQFPFVTLMDDRLYMAAGIESRIPFADYKYIETAVKIPAEYKIQEGFTKFLERSMKIGELPEKVLWRTHKLGFPAPFSEWFLKADPEYIMDLLHNPKSAKYFHVEVLRNEYKNGYISPEFVEFVNYEIFMRLFHMRTDD